MRARIVAACLVLAAAGAAAEHPGRAVYAGAGCPACHRVGKSGGNSGPDLTFVGFRRRREWLARWLRGPKDVKPDALMPDLKLRPADREAVVGYLADLRGRDYPGAADGRAVFGRAGCAACHGPAGRGGQPNAGAAGGVVPKLLGVSETYALAELKEKIRRGARAAAAPSGPEPSDMPAWGEVLPEADIDAVARYVMTLGAGGPSEAW